MVILEDSVAIGVPLDVLHEWISRLDEHFAKWHPNHTDFRLLSGGTTVCDTVCFEELVGSIPYRITGTIVKNEKTDADSHFTLETKYGLSRISFIGKKDGDGCVFTHTERFGLPDILWGRFVNFMLFRVLFRRRANWNLILEDMKQDNRNLKKYWKRGNIPYRRPRRQSHEKLSL